MALLQNELIYEGYITVYVKGAYTPVSSTKHVQPYFRLIFFFIHETATGLSYPERFQLYDFEHKEVNT